MLSAAIVREVSRTAVPATVSGWELTVGDLIDRTVGADWEDSYYQLRKAAAKRVAGEINKERPWDKRQVAPALPAGDAIKAIAAAAKKAVDYDLEGVVVQ